MLPLVAQGRAFGVFGLAFAVPYRFEEMQRAFLIALADLCALCLLSSERAEADAIREAERASANGLRAMSGGYGAPRAAEWICPEHGNGIGGHRPAGRLRP